MEYETSLLAERVNARMAELGLSQSEVARRGRFNAAFVSDLVRGRKRKLHEGNYPRLARALLTTVGYLKNGIEPSQDEVEHLTKQTGTRSRITNDSHTKEPSVLTDQDIPVYRSVGRFDGGCIIDQQPNYSTRFPDDFVPRNIYAVAISDTVMSPRYEPGEIVYADPYQNARPKDYVSILVKGRVNYREVVVAYVRQLLHEDAVDVIVRQLSPSMETRFPRSSVVGINRIAFAGEPLHALGSQTFLNLDT